MPWEGSGRTGNRDTHGRAFWCTGVRFARNQTEEKLPDVHGRAPLLHGRAFWQISDKKKRTSMHGRASYHARPCVLFLQQNTTFPSQNPIPIQRTRNHDPKTTPTITYQGG